MTTAPRSAAIVILLFGIAWTLPVQKGRIELTVANDAQPVAPQFEVRVRRNRLSVAGDARSAAHEQQLCETAARFFPAHVLDTSFRPLGVAPDWWETATFELIAALPGTLSPTARLRADSADIVALAQDVEAVRRRLLTLREVLPESVDLSLQISSAGPRVEADELCRRIYDAFEHGHIGFVESGTVMLTSAYPVLERVAALADACRDATLSIVGHTDSSGNEAQNRQLSLARAEAVADWLAGRGIDAGRLRVSGLGSSVPIADNATRLGRSQNRRIEVRLLAADAAIPASSD